MMTSEVITFTFNDFSTSITLYSHYTCIYGDSGIGKSWSYNVLRQAYQEGRVRIESLYPVVFADINSLAQVIQSDEILVIFVDEISLKQASSFIKKVNTSKHRIIAISRALPFTVNAPLAGIYGVDMFAKGQFKFYLLAQRYGFKIVSGDVNLNEYDCIITESPAERSECLFLRSWNSTLPKVICAKGAGNVPKVIRSAKGKILVFTDLDNVGQIFKLLYQNSKGKDVSFYNYGSFERFLYESDFVQKGLPNIQENVFEYKHLESAYEHLLAKRTNGTKLYMDHDKRIFSDCYFRSCGDHSCPYNMENKFHYLVNDDAKICLEEVSTWSCFTRGKL